MNSDMNEAAMAALRFLASIVERRATPRDAMTAFADVRKQHGSVEMQLLWEREAIGGTHHFDVVITAPNEGGVTVTVAPERGLPFIARGCRGREDQIATVNGEPIGSTNALVHLEVAHDAALIDRLIDATIIRQEVEREGGDFEPTSTELQAGVDGFRKRNALYRASDTRAWLERRGLSLRALEDRLASEIRVAKLRDKIVGQEAVERSFAEDAARFEEWLVTEATCATREIAETLSKRSAPSASELRAATLAGEISNVTTRVARKLTLPSDLAGGPGPVLLGDSSVMAFAEKAHDAVLDDATRVAIAEFLFRRWLDERRSASGIEWLWGGIAS